MVTAGSGMRLSEHERGVIREAAAEVFGPDVRVMLFGSRVDDSRRGGDIDLFVEPSDPADIMTKKIRLAAQLQMRLGEQKIDIVVASDSSRPIEQEARRTGVVL
jgi:predicted nucleotidyltransferase